MCCEGRENDLALYAGGDLPEHERAAVEAHLAACDLCKEFVAELETMRGTLGVMNDSAPDSEEMEIFTAHTVRATVAATQRRRGRRRMLAAACAIGFVSAGVAAIALQGFAKNEKTIEFIPHANEGAAVASGGDEPPGEVAFAVNSVENPARSSITSDAAEVPKPVKPDRVIAKLLTNDPKIVIILLASDRKDETHAKNNSIL